MNGQSDLKKSINRRLSLIVLVYVRSVSIGAMTVFAIFFVHNYFEFKNNYRILIMSSDVAVILSAFFMNFMSRRPKEFWTNAMKKITFTNPVNLLVSFAAINVLSNITLTFLILPRPISAVYLIIFYFGTSMVWLTPSWHIAMLITGITPWFIIGHKYINPSSFINYSIALIASAILSTFIISIRRRIHKQMVMLKINDDKTKKMLSTLVEEKKQKIEDKKRTDKEKLLLETQLIQAQKMEAVGRLAGGVAHDMGNMLAAISGTTQAIINEKNNNKHLNEDLASILSACKRGKELTANLLGFARKGKYKREKIDINKLINSIHGFTHINMPKKIIFETELANNISLIEGDTGQINQVILNLINNAIDAMGDAGHLVIKTENVSELELRGVQELEDATGNHIKIIISDTGIGMKPKTLEKVFEPFFSTKEVEGNTGLGLSMVYGTITNHGGAVLIRSAIGQGTSVTLYLPEYHRESLQIAQNIGSYEARPAKDALILLVDDEPLVRRSGQRLFSQMGLKVLTAKDGEDALKVYTSNQDQIQLVLLDLIMPKMDGEQTFNNLLKINPHIKVIFVSAYSKDTVRVDNLLERGAIDFIQKPFSIKEITKAIGYALSTGSQKNPE